MKKKLNFNQTREYIDKKIKFNKYARIILLTIFSFCYSIIFMKILADVLTSINLPIYYLIYIATIGLLIHLQICKFFNKMLFLLFPDYITL